VATHKGDGTGYFQHADWLGSSRLGDQGEVTVRYDRAYAPFGEIYAELGTENRTYTGPQEDTTAGIEDFLFRQYSPSQGRWVSPDPAGLAAVDITNPQTWNRYAYVGNNPLNATDPLGLYCAVNADGTGTLNGCTQGAAGLGWGSEEFGDWSGGWGEGIGWSARLWPVFLTGIWDVFGGIGGGGGSHPPSGGGSASNPYTNPNPTGNGSNNDPYTFHTWVFWPFPSDAKIGPYGPPKPTGWWSIFTTLPGTNYCGPGGRGKPRNGVDELCMEHDACEESSGANFRINFEMALQLPMSSHRGAVSNCNQTLCENLARLQPQSPGEAAQGLAVGAVFWCIP
jgi:RHS repeat-associated protein